MGNLMISIALICAFALLWVYFGKLLSLERRLSKIEGEIDRMWDRIEWLCEDTDNRLSVDRVELQQRALQIKNLQIRTKTIEKYLYLDAKDAFKEQEDGNDD